MTRIETKEQYEWAKARVEALLPLVGDNTPTSDPNSIELELLSNLVADYSDQHFQVGTPSLADVLELRLYEMKLTKKSLAEMLGVSQSRISEYMNNKSEPTLKVARNICRRLNIDPAIVLGV